MTLTELFAHTAPQETTFTSEHMYPGDVLSLPILRLFFFTAVNIYHTAKCCCSSKGLTLGAEVNTWDCLIMIQSQDFYFFLITTGFGKKNKNNTFLSSILSIIYYYSVHLSC